MILAVCGRMRIESEQVGFRLDGVKNRHALHVSPTSHRNRGNPTVTQDGKEP